jgi:hypothetical protein
VVIDGAIEATYTVTAADKGKKLSARITGSLTGYPDASRTTARSSTVS